MCLSLTLHCTHILLSPTFDGQTTRALKAEQDKAYLEGLNKDKKRLKKERKSCCWKCRRQRNRKKWGRSTRRSSPCTGLPGKPCNNKKPPSFLWEDYFCVWLGWIKKPSSYPLRAFQLSRASIFIRSVVDIQNVTLNIKHAGRQRSQWSAPWTRNPGSPGFECCSGHLLDLF